MSLQIKTQSYVEASRMIGRKDMGVIIRHVLPQLLPYAFASIAQFLQLPQKPALVFLD